MIDQKKRETLKNIGTIAAGSAAAAVSSGAFAGALGCLLYTSPSPRDRQKSRMPSSA